MSIDQNLSLKYLLSCLCLVITSHIPPVLADGTYRYKVEIPQPSIYPANIALVKRQQHAVLYRLVEQIQQSLSPALARDFARVALQEMAVLYETEAQRLSPDGMHLDEGIQVSRWQRQTVDYAKQLYRAADAIGDQSDVSVDIAETGELHIMIDGKPYIVGSPQLQNNLSLDQRVIEAFCSMHYCERMWPAVDLGDASRMITIEAGWVISEDAPPEFVTNDGLHFVFSDLEQRQKKQRLCLNISRELKTLLITLQEAQEMGLQIDWQSFSIKRLHGSYDYRIVINAFGDSVYMPFPALHAISDWPQMMAEWIQTRLDGDPKPYYFQTGELAAFAFN